MQHLFYFLARSARRKSSALLATLLLGMVALAMHRTAPLPADWVYDKTVSNVAFYHQFAECNGNKVVLLKMENKNNYNVKVSWSEVFDTQLQKGVKADRGQRQLVLSPGTTMASDCADRQHKDLLILPADVKPTYIVQIVQFSFSDIAVTPEK